VRGDAGAADAPLRSRRHAAVVRIALPPGAAGAPRARIPARLATDETTQKIATVVLAVGVTFVLREGFDGTLLETRVHYGRNLSRDGLFAAIGLHPVRAGVGALMDDAGNGAPGPGGAVLALAALEAPPRRGDALIVEALALTV
jgi:hypothetical protein